MTKSVKSLISNYLKKKLHEISGLIVKKSLLPATIFTKKQVETINKNFNIFWGLTTSSLEDSLFSNARVKFSTFTLCTPFSLWSHYFQTEEAILALRAAYTVEPFTTKSEEGAILCGTLFKKTKTTNEPSRTLIIFGGNGELYKIGSAAWVFKLLQDAPVDFDIVMFDLRECGNSQGIAYGQGLVIDGKAIYDYVKETLQVDDDFIDLCGFSLGGAIATLVKSYHPHTQGTLISNRSFQSLEKAVKEIFHPLGATFSKWIGSAAWKIADHSCWRLNPLEEWKSISSPKMVICHPKDPIIRYKASLEKGLQEHDLLNHCHHIQLHQKNPDLRIWNHHVQPLSFYNDQSGHDVQKLILTFLINNHERCLKSLKIALN